MQQEEPLLLGILDAEISEDVDWSVNKVGGLPVNIFCIEIMKLINEF